MKAWAAGYLQGDREGRLSWGYGRAERNKHPWTDGDLERDWRGEKKENEGRTSTDVQTNKLWVWGAMEPDTALGCWWKGMIKNTMKSIIVIQLTCMQVLWTMILADLLQTQLLTKSWPRRLWGRPEHCGSFLLCLSQHGRGLLTEARWRLSNTLTEPGNIITIKSTVHEWQWEVG